MTALLCLISGILIGYAAGSDRWWAGIPGVLMVLAWVFVAHSPAALQIMLSQ